MYWLFLAFMCLVMWYDDNHTITQLISGTLRVSKIDAPVTNK